MPREDFILEHSAQRSTGVPDPNIYDIAIALAMLDGDIELLQELAGLFLAETPVRLEQLRQGVATQDRERVHSNAHAIKGSLGAIGAMQVMTSAQTLENATRVANWQFITARAQRFEAEYNQLCTLLHKMFSTTPNR